jgi:hypothetical protein
MRWQRILPLVSLSGAALALGGCGDDSGAQHGVVSTAGAGGAAGSSGTAGSSGARAIGGASACSEVTPESVGCAARYEDQLKESALASGACGSHLAWLSASAPSVVCIYDMNSDLVYWRRCEDAPVACGTGSFNACRANGLDAPNGPMCFLMLQPSPPDAGNDTNGDAGSHDAGGIGPGDDAGPTDAG